jgi:ATP-dependent exoDNAse (exonuclease V) alpha subunit
MLQVFDLVEQLSARVVLVGDKRQHRSVTAGEPLKLLEDTAGLKVAEVTEILRQQGDYKKAAKALSEGRIEEGFGGLHKLGWIKEVADEERYKELADAYLSAAAEKKRDGKPKSALVVSPTHAEANRITDAIRDGLKAKAKLRDERIVTGWIPAHLTDAQKADATEYEPGDLLQFHQNAPGFTKGSRLIVGVGDKLPTELAKRFEVYRSAPLALAVGDAVRVTAGGKTKDGKHRLDNGTLLTVQGFTKRGDIAVNQGWVIDRDFGHLTHGYCITSHASQGVTVDKVFIGMSSESFPATSERTGYVAFSRGREQVQVFTNDREELLKALMRRDDTISATELAHGTPKKPASRSGLAKGLAFSRGFGVFGVRHDAMQHGTAKNSAVEKGIDHDR